MATQARITSSLLTATGGFNLAAIARRAHAYVKLHFNGLRSGAAAGFRWPAAELARHDYRAELRSAMRWAWDDARREQMAEVGLDVAA